MNQPLYIAPDEEIISVIARLRSLPETEVTLVFPKHSVVTQSIINLKLLAREGEKLHKQLTLVSQNENARSLAEKIGFATLPYTQEMEKGNLYLQGETTVTETPQPPIFIPEPGVFEPSQGLPDPNFPKLKSSDIGSQGFYQVSAPGVAKPMGDITKENWEAEAMRIQTPPPVAPPIPPDSTTLRVRNMSPERPPSLNSMRQQEPTPQDMSHQSTVSTAIFPDSYQATPPAQPQPTPPPTPPPSPSFGTPSNTPTAIKNFFERKESLPEVPVRMPQPQLKPAPAVEPTFTRKAEVPAKAPVMVGSNVSSKLTTALISLVVLLIVATGALGFFLIFPTATVTVNPQTVSDAHDQSFTVDVNGGSSEVPLEKSTQELTVNIAGIASGASATPTASGSRAKGKLKISNTYSNDPQNLVATTRFESADGKIYRIQQSITVPGNGSVEAEVVADGSGESYNMTEGTFTIPGFKGSDKYEKFSASIAQAISGGGGNETTSSGTFIRADEETLRGRAMDEAKKMFTENSNTEDGDKYTFTDGLQLERVTEANMPKVGTVPGEYEYSAVFKITAFTTSKDVVTKAVIKNIRSDYDGITFVPTTQELSFADFTLNKESTQASLKVHLETTLAAEINEASLKTDLAGKSAVELENFTTEHPEIKGLSITFSPSWALKRIPSNPGKITLVKE